MSNKIKTRNKSKYNLNNKNIDGLTISKNKLKFNLLFLDDTSINQMVYHSKKNKNKINIKLIKSTHLKNLLDLMINSQYSEYIIVENL